MSDRPGRRWASCPWMDGSGGPRLVSDEALTAQTLQHRLGGPVFRVRSHGARAGDVPTASGGPGYHLVMNSGGERRRVFISYAREGGADRADVWELAVILQGQMGIEVALDTIAKPDDWVLWMTTEMDKATHIIVVASPEYKSRGEVKRTTGYGVEH